MKKQTIKYEKPKAVRTDAPAMNCSTRSSSK
jgi:hypothetical protein